MKVSRNLRPAGSARRQRLAKVRCRENISLGKMRSEMFKLWVSGEGQQTAEIVKICVP
jgi:hypothetical protein